MVLSQNDAPLIPTGKLLHKKQPHEHTKTLSEALLNTSPPEINCIQYLQSTASDDRPLKVKRSLQMEAAVDLESAANF